HEGRSDLLRVSFFFNAAAPTPPCTLSLHDALPICTCRFKGALVFAVPRAETLAVTWYGSPEQALIYGWPVDLGPFAGVGASRVGDSLVGAILFDSQLGVQVRPGVTARFVAGRARREAP